MESGDGFKSNSGLKSRIFLQEIKRGGGAKFKRPLWHGLRLACVTAGWARGRCERGRCVIGRRTRRVKSYLINVEYSERKRARKLRGSPIYEKRTNWPSLINN